jgi:predicted DNA-binding mobile mystery protein A
MVQSSSKQIARDHLDDRLDDLRGVVGQRPHAGWIRATRDALGMSGTELARRMGIAPQTLAQIEKNETSGSIRLETLERAARALNADLVYAVVPRIPLQQMVESQARDKARSQIGPIAHHSRLEDQALPDELDERQVEELAAKLMDKRRLWTTDDADGG